MDDVDLTIGPPAPPDVDAQPVDELEAELVDELGGGGEGAVSEAEIRGLLEGLGDVAHMIAADEDVPRQWRFDDDELDSITPPLTRIVNRRPAMQRAVRRGDGFLVVLGLTGYLSRNIDDGREARRARGELEHREADGRTRWGRTPPAPHDRGSNGDQPSPGGAGPGGAQAVHPAPRGDLG